MDPRRKQLEKEIQSSILEYLQARGLYCWKQNNVGIKKPNGKYIPSNKKGVSDILGLTKSGRFFAIEVKRSNGKMSFDQAEFQFAIRANNGIAFVAKSVDEVISNQELWK